MRQKAIGVLVCVLLQIGCSNPRSLVLTDANRLEVAEKIGKSSMSPEEKQLFMAAIGREGMGAMAKAFGMPAPSLHGKTVAQVIEEERRFGAEMLEAASQEEARVAAEKAKAAEANRLISTSVQVTVAALRTVSGIITHDVATFSIHNTGARDIAALVGTVAFDDLFGKELHSAEVRFNATIPAGKTVEASERFFDAYGVRNLPFDKVRPRWTSKAVAFTDGTTIGDGK